MASSPPSPSLRTSPTRSATTKDALGTRAAGTIDVPNAAGVYAPVNYVQGLNGPAGYNSHLAGTDKFGVYSTYYVTPPRTYGVEFHYKFF